MRERYNNCLSIKISFRPKKKLVLNVKEMAYKGDSEERVGDRISHLCKA